MIIVAASILFLLGIAGLGTGIIGYTALIEAGIPPLGPIFVGALLVITSVFLGYFSLYRKTAANEAFVRTGQGGAKVILDDGAMVIPILHKLIPVSLETMKLEVERVGADALITHDNLRVDVRAEFYIRVSPERGSILQAARSLGHKSVDAGSVGRLVYEKLVSALRSVAAQKDLFEIHSNRVEFASGVQELVSEELSQNGLLLESVTISRFDQTDVSGLSDDNIFDAQGKKKITEITAAARVERNRLERDAEQEITTKDVDTAKRVLELERERAEVAATQQRDVANIQAERQRDQDEFRIRQEQAVREQEIATQLAVEAADIARQREIIKREQAQQETDIERTRAVEVAEQLKEVAVAEQEAARAKAEEEVLLAQAEQERANQQVITVEAEALADRTALTKLIAAKQVIEEDRIRRQIDAEVLAFRDVKESEAGQRSAELDAKAKLTRATADAEAIEKIAKAEQAQKMVDVNVDREQVSVQEARVEVQRQDLENRQTFDRAAIQFEVQKLRIEADKQVRVALAQAMGDFMSRGNYNVYGTPETMSAMFEQYQSGMGFSNKLEGLLTTLPDPVRQALEGLADNAGEALKLALSRLGNSHNGEGDAPVAEAEVDAEVDAATEVTSPADDD